MPAFCEKNWPITVNLLTVRGKAECRERLNGLYASAIFLSSSEAADDQKLPEPVAPAITKIDRRPLRINTI
jgi:hypothetical protein